MVILNFLQCSPDGQTILEFPIYSKHSHSAITMLLFLQSWPRLKLRTINTKYGNYHIIIVPNANILVHNEQNLVFKHAEKNKK